MIRIRTFSPESIFKTGSGKAGVMLDTEPGREYASYNPVDKKWDYSVGHRLFVPLWRPSGESVLPELPGKTKDTHDIELLLCEDTIGVLLAPTK